MVLKLSLETFFLQLCYLDVNVDSPPEPAPPEVPPRGPSLHHPGGGHTLGRGGRTAQERQDIFLSQGKNETCIS